jgi:uncharacterized metal-binding protein
MDVELKCATCAVQACAAEAGTVDYPAYCPIPAVGDLLAEARRTYGDDDVTRAIAPEAARTEAAGYCRETRVEEVMSFARRLGASHLGIAFCIGLRREAALAQKIFETGGFRVSSVCCKVGSVPKEEVGLRDDEKIRPGQFEALCNPVAQARLLEAAGTELNVAVGLCVGHDSLFFRHSAAPVTVLIAKDRVTGHNPAAALYTSASYYKKLLNDPNDRKG